MLTTEVIKIDSEAPEEEYLRRAAAILRRGGLVAFPTETVYGLGAAVNNGDSIKRIFKVKGRPGDNPLIVHIYKWEQLAEIVLEVPERAVLLAKKFWPGPLTLILPKKDTIPSEVSAGLPTVAIRIPAHPVALGMLRQTGIPVAAPSANLSGRPSPTRGAHVISDLGGKVDLILDAGATGVGLESTVLDLTSACPRILRPGGITFEMLEEVLGKGGVEAPQFTNCERPLAPGMKYRHYAPQAPLRLFTGDQDAVNSYLAEEILQEVSAGKKVGLLAYDEDQSFFPRVPGLSFFSLGKRLNPAEGAERLYNLLRLCDQVGVEQIYAVAPPRVGVGEAIFNRLWKASGGRAEEIK
ncbi:MAG TPA: threonylcarbamoyl-AMP synthase [Firmicutes bacterium]|jgi:L-threonylcarbamoyladenylate synthase|nr:threonylcarbamoyl-AMP synthase [Bacillota bacterium]